jgi:hypothetical protein
MDREELPMSKKSTSCSRGVKRPEIEVYIHFSYVQQRDA